MKALIWDGPERMHIEQVPEPSPAPGTVLLRSEAAGICGSEVEGYLGRMANRVPPLVMGHEFAGTVIETGDGVEGTWIGCLVAVNPLVPCGTCRLCRAGLPNICPHRTMIGIQHPGGFAELVRVPVHNVAVLPHSVAPATGALAEPLANGVHAVRLALESGPVERVLIVGAGTIGLMVMEAAVIFDIAHVGVVEPFPPRREHARRFGAHAVYASIEEAAATECGIADGLGVDLVIDAVGAVSTRRGSMQLLRPGGTLIALGLRDDETPLPFHSMVRNQIMVRGSYAYTPADYRKALDWLIEGRAGIGDLPDVMPLDRGPEVFAELSRGPTDRIKVFLSPWVS